MPKCLVTGAAGFIGFHTSQELLKRGYEVIGIDNINDYYDPQLKFDRLKLIEGKDSFSFEKIDLADSTGITSLFEKHCFDSVINLAAQAGVRYSLKNPSAYIQSNLVGFGNILECSRNFQIKHLVYASSSSVYGLNTKMPWSVHANVDHPVSLYAATKKSNELMAHSYSHLFGLPTTGLRFFTVYGPWGRPDMAAMLFARAILEGKPIQVFNEGKMKRDFTYIDDIVHGVIGTLEHVPEARPSWNSETPDPATSSAPYQVYNIGNNQPVELLHFIEVLEECLGKQAVKEFLPMQAGDVKDTYADVSDLTKDVGFAPTTSIEDGLKKFSDWYKLYYRPS